MQQNEPRMKIGQVARAASVNVETLRYYERIGLIAEPPRRPDSRYRMYPARTVDEVRFIKRAQQLGFSLNEIRDLLALEAAGPDVACDDVRAIAGQKIADIDARVRDLTRMSGTLKVLVSACESGRSPVCPIIATLTDAESNHE